MAKRESVSPRRRKSSWEPLLNKEMADLLTKAGIADCVAEERQGGKQPDVLANVNGVRVIIEAEIGSKSGAIKDADDRIKQNLTSLVYAACYPKGLKVNDLASATLEWTLRTRTLGSGSAEWNRGSVNDLADAVKHAPDHIGDADMVARILSEALDKAVGRMTDDMKRALARALDLPERPVKVAAKRGMLVIATSMLFHHRLHGHLGRKPREWDGPWPPASPAECAEATDCIPAHRLAWKAILAEDYKPVFRTALSALDSLPIDAERNDLIRSLAGDVAGIAGRTVGLRHDLLGRIFHRILDTAPYDGSFYTGTAAATLLAGLALREGDRDWGDDHAIASLRVCDPACGTGTLLMAAAERLYSLRRGAGKLSEDDEALLAQFMAEDVLWGYDTNLTATHLAASTIGMLAPKTSFERLNVHRVLLGLYPPPRNPNRKPRSKPDDPVPYIGSTEYLSGSMFTKDWPSTQQVDSDEVIEHRPPKMDLVIMNPPFTRDSLRHDQFTAKEEQMIKAREKEILGRYEGAARLSGSANAFLVLGEDMTSADGTLAVVLPTVMATNPAAFETRRYLAKRFHIDTIISSHDPKRHFFSENTGIGESLMVYRRWNKDAPKPATRFVNLSVNPGTGEGAAALARTIDSGEAGPSFTVQWIDEPRIASGDWYAVNFLSPRLVEAYRRMADGESLFATTPLGDVADVGPDGRVCRGCFNKSALPTLSGMRALWHQKTGVTTSMDTKTDVFVEPIRGKERATARYWEQRSRLLLPHKLRLNNARVSVARVETPALGSLWTPCRPHDGGDAMEAALCVWFNSSLGILAMLGGRNNRILARPDFSIDTLRSLPIPAMGEEARDTLAAAFARWGKDTLQPLPKMNDDPVRVALDQCVADALGLEQEWVDGIRRELAREPSITNKPYGA